MAQATKARQHAQPGTVAGPAGAATERGEASTDRRPWRDDEIAHLIETYADTKTATIAAMLGRKVGPVYQMAAKLGLKKSTAYLAGPDASRLRRGDEIGKPFRFPKGHVPANKGVKGWQAGGRSAETQFKPGTRQGRAAKIYQPIGAERISKDGYLERKINDGMPFQKRWRAVHLIEWEAANGPLPPGHAIAFRNGDKTDRRLDNLELVTRAELMRRNTYHRYPKEIAQAIQLRGALQRVINRRTKARGQRNDD